MALHFSDDLLSGGTVCFSRALPFCRLDMDGTTGFTICRKRRTLSLSLYIKRKNHVSHSSFPDVVYRGNPGRLCHYALTKSRERAQRRYEQNLQVSLAAECDPETAKLMRKQFEQAEQVGTPSAEQKAFRLKYIDKVSDPMFQACYKMAWQNYISQQQLREARYYRYYDEWGFPFYRPYYWW